MESEIENAKPQFALNTLLKATFFIAVWLVVLRYATVFGVFLGLTTPMLMALRLRKRILATPFVRHVAFRLPLFLTLFSMFWVGALGPFVTVLTLTDTHQLSPRFEAVILAMFWPVHMLGDAFPILRPAIATYLEFWDMRA